jgi:hypothetical protein
MKAPACLVRVLFWPFFPFWLRPSPLTFTLSHAARSQSSSMQIIIKCQGAHVVEVAAETSVEAIKAFIEAQEGVSAAEQYVTFGGRPLEGLLAEAGLSELSTVEVGVRMLGGT